MIRRFRDAALLLVALSNTYHLANAAARLFVSRRGMRDVDPNALVALIQEQRTHGL